MPALITFGRALFDGTNRNIYTVFDANGEQVGRLTATVEDAKAYIERTGLRSVSIMQLHAIRSAA